MVSVQQMTKERWVNVTIADVARRANVGAGTVSRVLNGSKNVSRETREKVEACIRELGYMPNLVARGLAANRTGMISAIIPAIGYTQHAEVMQGLGDVLHENGIQIMIGHCGYSPEREEQIVANFLERRPDAFYLTGGWHTPQTRQLLQASGLPVVEGANLFDDPIDSVVGYDNFEAGRQIAHLLYSRGHRRMAIVTSSRDPNDRIADRLRGYLAAVRELEIDMDELVFSCENSFLGGAEAVDRATGLSNPVDLLLCSTDVMAVGAVFQCHRRGLSVPGQLAICGFDDLPIARSLTPALTTVSVDRVEMGRRAGQLLLQRIAGETAPHKRIDVGFVICERESTYAPVGGTEVGEPFTPMNGEFHRTEAGDRQTVRMLEEPRD
ncbi:LacI family DNA-binding transcriptional regulator [Microvirga sp. VF16]|uniref:LacI family DNA-binding transcriptional regulator n=1 Tax=Microvirga sp. VF16 TaxID=2807101 RepID=UPI00193E2E15|nr:LacI family DNA-binding transcriptional regulator [Microvirga sp. VF16]QRM33384.1 LacI family DNA-binding transcriptional regulator [Microvirga sp. VF16]